MHHGAFGQFQLQQAGVDVSVENNPEDGFGHLAVVELAERQIDRKYQAGKAHFGALLQALAGLLYNPVTNGYNQATALRHRYELVGPHQASLGMIPAQKALDATNLFGRQIDSWLIVELQLFTA